jgi:hypothetical protein
LGIKQRPSYLDLNNLNQRDRVITELQIGLDLETFKEVLEWLPSELRERILDKSNVERIGSKHPAIKWAVFMEEKEGEMMAFNSPAFKVEDNSDPREEEKVLLNVS